MCGRVIAYQRGSPSAFQPTARGGDLEGVYIEGVSLTHGPAGSRQHIWSFVAALFNIQADQICPCSNIEIEWDKPFPEFVGSDYFCDTGNSGSHDPTFFGVYSEDPLWDGVDCPSISTCCEFNTPPWFCTTLDQATSDDIEMRICMDEPIDNEGVDVELFDFYVM